MKFSTNLSSGLLGAAALVLTSQANAAVISLNPSVSNVLVGDTFTLTVSGSDFLNGVTAGGVDLTWDNTKIQLVSGSVTMGSIAWFPFISEGAGSLTVDALNLVGEVGPTFDFFSVDFLAVPPPSSGPVDIFASAIALDDGWQNLFDQEEDITAYNGATVNVSAVPVPAAVWLFGSGLIGLVGIARRRTTRLA